MNTNTITQVKENPYSVQPNAPRTHLCNVGRLLEQCKAEIAAIEWSDDQIDDARLGEHLIALEQHIDNAIGRNSTACYRANHRQ